MSSDRIRWSLLAVFIAALAVRVSVNAMFQGLTAPPNPGFPDTLLYADVAKHLELEGRYLLHGRDTVALPPGIPVALAAALTATSDSWLGPRLLYSLLGALTCLFAYGVAAHVAGRRAGLLSAALLALYPEHFYYSMHFSPETPGAFCLMAGIWLSCRLDRRQSNLGQFALGAVLGLAALVTPRMLVLIPFLLLLRLAAGYRTRLLRGLQDIAIVGVGFLVVLAPWAYRNYLVSGEFVLVSSHGGSTFLAGNNALVESNAGLRGGWYEGPMQDIPGWSRIRGLPEAEKSREETRLALDFLRSLDVWRLTRLEAMKLYRFLTPILNSPNWTYRVLVGGGWALLFPLVLVGLWAFGRSPGSYGLNAVLVSYVLITLVFFGEGRYRAAIAPVLVVYAGMGAAYLIRWVGPIGRQREPPRIAASGV